VDRRIACCWLQALSLAFPLSHDVLIGLSAAWIGTINTMRSRSFSPLESKIITQLRN
jgi:hypothetical protein